MLSKKHLEDSVDKAIVKVPLAVSTCEEEEKQPLPEGTVPFPFLNLDTMKRFDIVEKA